MDTEFQVGMKACHSCKNNTTAAFGTENEILSGFLAKWILYCAMQGVIYEIYF